MTDVVTIESNPTGEDHSIDEAIGKLFETPEEVVEIKEEANEDVVQDEVAEEDSEVISEDETDEFTLPENMPKELQDALNALEDENVKKTSVDIFKKMQGSFTKKNQDFAEQKKFAETINETFEAAGFSGADTKYKEGLVKNYIAFDRMVESNPKQAVEQLMKYAGVKPEDFGVSTSSDAASDDEYLTESEKKQINEINALKQKIESLERNTQDTIKQEQYNIVSQFKDAKNESGELLHPHFLTVKKEMMDLAAINPNLTIDELYNKAIRMNDDLYKTTIEQERKAALNDVEARRKAEIEKAKKQNRQNPSLSSVDSKVTDEDSIYELLATQAGF